MPLKDAKAAFLRLKEAISQIALGYCSTTDLTKSLVLKARTTKQYLVKAIETKNKFYNHILLD